MMHIPNKWMFDKTVHADGVWNSTPYTATVQNSLKGKSMPKENALDSLVIRFKKANTLPLLAGAKRAATCYIQRRCKETGSKETRVRAAVKAVLSRNGITF
jgi:hypothetical protein